MSVTEIGRKLKKARLDANLKQSDVARILGITYQAISNYERGINRVDSDTLLKLCNIYGIKISDLLKSPAWTAEMISEYQNAETEEERQALRSLWGTPSFLIEEENNRREPDPSPLSDSDLAILYAYHHASAEDRQIIDNIVKRYVPVPTASVSDQSIDELEEEYKKRRSASASTTTSNAFSITTDAEKAAGDQ